MKEDSAIKTLENLGYTYHGGELWKPPLGQAPDFDLIDSLRSRLESLEKDAEQMHDEIVNLRVNEDSAGAPYTNWREAYLWGHRDARHAAAELVAAMQANKGE